MGKRLSEEEKAEIVAALMENPSTRHGDLAALHGCSIGTISIVARSAGIVSKRGRKPKDAPRPLTHVDDSLGLSGGRWVRGRDGVDRWVS